MANNNTQPTQPTLEELKVSFYDTLALIQAKQEEVTALSNLLKSIEEAIKNYQELISQDENVSTED